MTAYIKKRSSVEDQIAFQDKLKSTTEVGWLRDIREPDIHIFDDSPESLERSLTEKEEYTKDKGELRMCQLFCEGVENLYTGMIEGFVRKTPALWKEFAMRDSPGNFYLVDPDPHAATRTEPTSENICLDIHNNVQFSPNLCLWTIDQELESKGEVLVPGQFAESCHRELTEYVQSRAEVGDSFYNHLVIKTQSRTFQDKNYVNTSGSKVVIKSVAGIMQLSVKKEQDLKRTMVIPQVEKLRLVFTRYNWILTTR